ncbi:MAG: T9SS type A sorting domain-containing protein [Bacteroidetes bacterium]|nr:T9SS type A sorting domain-containing protein [Bacteroidota bacterium]
MIATHSFGKIFLKYLTGLCLVCLAGASVAQSHINKMEYFIDVDPGFGNATNVVVSPALDINAVPVNVPIASLSMGVHSFCVRSRNAQGKWSLTNNVSFLKYAAQNGSNGSLVNINKLEYFIDNDPGIGNGVNVPVTSALDINNLAIPVNVGALGSGLHFIAFRSRDLLGRWSLTNSAPFIKYLAQTNSSGLLVPVVKAEYFLDIDPGFGNGTNIPLTAANDINGIAVAVNIGSLGSGLHTFSVRSMDSLGRWSLTNHSSFLKYSPQTYTMGPLVPVVRAEYFIDTDPGFGNGSNISLTAANDINGLALAINIGSLSSGVHSISVRSQDSLGRWSLTNNSSFIKYTPQTRTIGPLVNIVKMEYFFDNDPGFGNGFDIPVTPTTDINNLAVPANLNSLAPGIHAFHIRSRDALGRWSITNHGGFNGGSLQGPTAVVTVNGSTPLCVGTGFLKVNQDISPLATYQWQLNNNNISGATDSIYYPTQSGFYTAVVSNPVGADTSSAVNVTVHPVNTVTITAYGPTTFCQGGNVVIEAGTGYNTYLWSSQDTGRSITALATDSFVVEVTDVNGCKVRNGIMVTVNPNKQFSFSHTICTGDFYNFNGQNLTVSGIYKDTVTASNGCDSVITLTLNSQNTATTSITATICIGSSYSFNGQMLTASGTYYDSLQTVFGCDSIVTLTLQANSVITNSVNASICQGGSYAFRGMNLTAPGTYTDTLSAQGGCDSIVTLTLAVNSLPTVFWSSTKDTICSDAPAFALTGGNPTGGLYSGDGVSNNQFSPGIAGDGSHVITYTYTDNNSCFATATKTLVVVTCTRINGMDYEHIISLFPNPAVDQLMLQSDLFNTEKLAPVISDVSGKKVPTSFIQNANQLKLDISHLASGLYFIRLNISGEQVSLKFVK